MPNNYLSVLYKHIIQVENKNVGSKVCVCVGGGGEGGHKHTIARQSKMWGHIPPPPASYASVYIYKRYYKHACKDEFNYLESTHIQNIKIKQNNNSKQNKLTNVNELMFNDTPAQK